MRNAFGRPSTWAIRAGPLSWFASKPLRAMDKAYDADWIREMIWEQGAIDVIPPKANRKLPAEFNAEIYRERNRIERFFGRIKSSFRRIATRYEKTSANFMAMIKLASVRLWCRFYESAA